MNARLAALRDAELTGYTAERALAELSYAYELCKQNESCRPLFDSACDALYRAYMKDGAITKAALAAMEETLQPFSPAAKALRVILTAHAHIDMNWMWGFQETALVTLDTFRTMLDLMREYPKFTFAQSQASVYRIVEQYAPEMLDEIRVRVREGRWELTASTWVETDKNMPDGESLTRHILQTKRYLQGLFGIDPNELKIDFEPDTFGHNANVPEICRAGGVSYYYHCRGYEGHHIYRWRAPSGAELLCYREPMWYNADVKPMSFVHLPAFCAGNGIDTALFVYGVGDHGGGPTRRDVERLLDMQSWPLMPTLEFGTFRQFFDSLNERKAQFPVVEGELNYIFTGCYTSQSRIKALNRISEARMNEAEALCAMDTALTGKAHPTAALQDGWRALLFNHFHDIIPGSGTVDTREYAMGQFQSTLAAADTQASAAMRSIAAKVDTSRWILRSDIDSRAEGAGVGYGIGSLDSGAYRGKDAFAFTQAERGTGTTRIFTIFNTTQYTRKERIELTVWDYPAGDERVFVTDAAENPLPFEVLGRQTGYWGHEALKVAVTVEVGPLGYATVLVKAGDPVDKPLMRRDPRVDSVSDDDLILENENLRAVFVRETMALVCLQDKKSGRTLIDGPACLFRDILESNENRMTSWRVGPYEKVSVLNSCVPAHLESFDPHGFTYSLAWRDNKLTARISLEPGAFALRFNVSADWLEHGSKERGVPQLNFTVPFAQHTENYLYDIPYGMIERPALCHDVPALSFAAAPDGLFLASDTKYGFRGADDALSVTLLRASYDPDPYPELGRHHFNLYVGMAPEGDLLRAAACLKHPLHAISTPAHTGLLPLEGSLAAVSGPARLYALKNAEDGGLILRVVGESDGEAQIRFARALKSCERTDSAELTGTPVEADGDTVRIPLKTGQICTLRVQL